MGVLLEELRHTQLPVAQRSGLRAGVPRMRVAVLPQFDPALPQLAWQVPARWLLRRRLSSVQFRACAGGTAPSLACVKLNKVAKLGVPFSLPDNQ